MASLVEVLIAAGGLGVATVAAVYAVKTYMKTKLTTAIAADDHRQRNAPISSYLIDGFSWREKKNKRKCFFAISLTNSSTTPTSIVKAELHLKLYVSGGVTSEVILQPTSFPLPENAETATSIQPINLAAGTTESIWISYEIPEYVNEKFTVDKYEVVFTSGNGFRVGVHQYIMKEIENAKGKS